MICDTTAKILLSAVEISLDLRTKRSFYLLAHNIIKALIDQPADHTNIESQNSQTTSSFPYVATAVPTICNSLLLATKKSCDLNRSAAVRKHHYVLGHATHHLSVVTRHQKAIPAHDHDPDRIMDTSNRAMILPMLCRR